MGSSTQKRRNQNRYRKVYPIVRRTPKYFFVSTGGNFQVEVIEVDFSNESSKVYNFTILFSTAPIVTATPSNDNVSIVITSVSTTQVSIESSQAFTGTVHIHAINAT